MRLKVDRLTQILDLVNSRKRIALSQLETQLDVSRITIQRHLVELEERGLLKRFHGGAMSIEFSTNLSDHTIRKTINVTTKRSIVARAAALIKPGMVVGLDASSTVYYLSEQILPSPLTVVTCGIDTFSVLSKKQGVHAILSGGTLNRQTNNLAGSEAIDTIRRFSYDLVFISAEWFDIKRGFFDPYDDEAQVKRAFIGSAKKVAVLLDSSKIAQRGGVRVAQLDQIDYLITDNPSNKKLKALLGARYI